MSYSRLLVILLFMVLVSACSHQEKRFVALQPEVDEAIVYVYRPASLSNAVISPMLLVNGNKTIRIKQDGFTYFKLPAGSHDFSMELGERYDGVLSTSITLVGQQVYFLRVDTQLKFKKNDLYYRRFDIGPVDSAVALGEIGECRNLNQQSVIVQEVDAPEIRPVKEDNEVYSISKSRDPFSKNK